MFLSANQVNGDVVAMLKNNSKHLDPPGIRPAENSPEKSFTELLVGAFGQVNEQQILSQELSQLMVSEPDAVDVHDVTIAMAEANMALSITKSVVDKALQAYKEIINLR